MINNVPGIATIPVTAIAVRTLRKLARVRNAGARIENVTISTSRTTTRAVIFGAARRRREETASRGSVSAGSATAVTSAGWFRAAPPAAVTSSLAVIWSPSNSRTIRPRTMTRRSANWTTSSWSLVATSTASAFGQGANRSVDLLAGPNINAPGRFDEQQHPDVAFQPPAQEHLLLVASRQRRHRLPRVVPATGCAGGHANVGTPPPLACR